MMQRLLIAFILLAPLRAASLEKVDLKINGHILHVEVATTAEEKSKGLMNRKEMAPNDGMIFIFTPPERVSFWMKNTLIPLSLAFVDEKLTIVEMHDLNPPVSIMQRDIPRADSQGPILIVIEMNQGWFKKNKIPLHARVELVSQTKNALIAKIFAAHAGQKSSSAPTH